MRFFQGKSCRKAAAFLLAVLVLSMSAGCGTTSKAQNEQLWGRSDAKEIDINSKIAGRVVELTVKEGDTVKKGQVIAHIDKRDLEAQRNQYAANIEAIAAQQGQASATTRMQSGTTQSALGEAQAAAQRAKADLNLTASTDARYAELLSSAVVSQQEYDNVHAKYEAAQAAYTEAQAAVAKAGSGLMQTEVNRANENAIAKNLEKAQAALDQLDVSLDETEIRAPFDGIITAKYIEEGSMISQGMPLVAIQDPLDNWVDLKVPETQLANYQLDQQIELVGRDGKTKVQGVITDISKKSEFATQRETSERGDDSDIISFNVKIQVNSEVLRPGMRFRLAGEAS